MTLRAAREIAQHRWNAMGRWQTMLIFSITFAWYLVTQWRYRWVPPYYDGLWQYYPATWMADHSLWPFVPSGDTGHPPLVAWSVAALMKLGLPHLVAMHLYSWMAVSILVTGTWKLVRRIAGEYAAFAAAAVCACLPIVSAQALQLTGDLSLAAFTTLMIAYLVEGRYWRAALAGIFVTLAKLNGIIVIGSIGCAALVFFFARRGRIDGKFFAQWFWPVFLPACALVVYTLIKGTVTGHYFDDGSFMAGNQLTTVSTWGRFEDRFWMVVYTAFLHNGMTLLLTVLFAGGCCVVLRWSDGRRNTVSPEVLTAAVIFLSLFVLQVLSWSMRDYIVLPRYYTLFYPPMLAVIAWAFGTSLHTYRRRVLGLGALALIAWFRFVSKPDNLAFMPRDLRERLLANPAHVDRNFETNEGFLEILRNYRSAAEKIDKRAKPGDVIAVPAWFESYFANPDFGFVKSAHTVVTTDLQHNRQNECDYLVVSYPTKRDRLLKNGPEGSNGRFELIQQKKGVTVTVGAYVNRDRIPSKTK